MTCVSEPRWVVLGVTAVFTFVGLSGNAQETQAKTAQPSAHRFAQTLVDKTLAAHPESDEIGIAVPSGRRCTVVASSDKSDVGETCEADDSAPIRTGKPHVGKEGGEFDVAVPLHDKTGAPVGAVTVRFKKANGQVNASVTSAAVAIADELAGQIPSKAALLGR
ncbi:MAG: PDC sensor domain-containing protein [Vicinamibacterales bacterium]